MRKVVLIAVMLWCVAGAGIADPGRPHDAPASSALTPLASVLERHAARLNGRLLDVELERKRGRWVYELKVLGRDGTVREFVIDAVTGDWIDKETSRR
jgi:uncharacterized membrane protein YkoI